MTEEMYVYNELADTACESASSKYTHLPPSNRTLTPNTRWTKLARRIATIEASTWKEDNDFTKHHGKTYKDLAQSRTDAVKRQAADALDNTAVGSTRSLYTDGKWHRCRDCPGLAKIGNLSYWANMPCTRAVRKIEGDYIVKVRAGVKRYLKKPDAEEFRIHSDDDDDDNDKTPPTHHSYTETPTERWRQPPGF